ncbi:17158_t:CDS:2 [Acaulospora morrowiae]|uniref:17158_t:CDS:1 n=1 Tax=Acaulospora morrowiae TaxID=94023 RepID=A0A9N8V9A6_9GLOM|nr:17158_t:CDS:2 [Acaulospora morrowiae]
MSVIFTNEILGKIFAFSDVKTLHSCLLSSRLLCTISVPFLWSTPLEYLYSNQKIPPKWTKVYSLAQIYISCLTDDSISLLKSSKIPLTPSIVQQRPTYDYSSFLQNLDYKLLFDCVAVWLNRSEKSSMRSTRQHYLVVEELSKLFFIRTTNLKSVSCKVWPNLINNGLAPNYLTLTALPSAEICLKSLEKFSVKDSVPTDFCEGFSRVSKGIKNLELQPMDKEEDDEMFAGLIKSLKKLETIIIFSTDPDKYQLPQVANALKQHVRSLKTISLCYKISVPLNIFTDCVNLVDLRISHLNQTISSSTFELLSKTQFTQLKVLHINSRKLYLGQIAMLIQNTGGQIVDVYLEYERKYGTEHSIDLINSIAENCSNLKELRAFIPNEAIHRLPYLFTSCPRLNSVCWLDGDSEGEDEPEETVDISDAMIEMSKVYPKNLYEFLVFAHWEFSGTALKCFLWNCERRLSARNDRKLDLFVPAWGEDQIPVIKAYGKKGFLEMRDWTGIIQQYYTSLNQSDEEILWDSSEDEQDSDDSGVDVMSSPAYKAFRLSYVADTQKNVKSNTSLMANDEFDFLSEVDEVPGVA